jgi:hypothetical protein
MVMNWRGLGSDGDVISCTVPAFTWREWEIYLNSRFPDRYLNSEPSEYEAGVLTQL